MLCALKAGEQKLATYYKDTEKAHGHLYAMGTILTPVHKLDYFKGADWAGDDADWYTVYESSLHSYLKRYYQRQPTTQSVDKGKAPQRTGSMSSLLAQTRPRSAIQEKVGWREELTGYLNLRMYTIELETMIYTNFARN